MTDLLTEYFSPTRGVSIPEVDRAYVELERAGFALDVPYLNSQAEKANRDEEEVLKKLSKYASSEVWSSPKQLVELLHTTWKLEPSPIYKKGEVAQWKGEIKVDNVAIEWLANRNPDYSEPLHLLLELKKIRSSAKYLNKLPLFVDSSDGLVHPVYGPASDSDESVGAKSGRTVQKNPEGQQIPASSEKDSYAIRKGFVAPKGYVLTVRDYSAMEAVLLHSICKSLFNDESLAEANSDTFHAENARLIYGNLGWKHNGKSIHEFALQDFKKDPYLKSLRSAAKTVFYGLQYMKGVRGFAYTLLDSDGNPIGENLARDIVTGFNQVRTGIKKYHEFVYDYIKLSVTRRDTMSGIAGFSGRWRDVGNLLSDYARTGKECWKFRKAHRQCANHPIQEGGAAVKTTALVHLQRRLRGMDAVVQMDIHDELVVRNREKDQAKIDVIMQETMEETYPLPCGVKLKTAGACGPNWYEAK